MTAALSLALRRSGTVVAMEPRGQTAWQRFVYGAALLVTALFVGLLVLAFGPPWLRSLFVVLPLDAPAALGVLFAATAVSVLLHELGHLLAAVVLDFEILGLSLGPMRLQWMHGKYALRFSAKRLFASSIAAMPKEMRNWRVRAMCVAAAGPLATLLIAIAASGVVIWGSPAGVQKAFWCALAQVNIFVFVLGLIPNGARAAVRNDATLFWILLQNGPAAHELELVHLIGQLRLDALRPSGYPEPLLDRLIVQKTDRSETRVLVARTLSDWALDSGDLRMADHWDREAAIYAAHSDPRLRNHALAASACWDVLFRGDSQAARAKFTRINVDELFPPCFAHRAKAVRFLALGQPQLAPAQVIRAQYALPTGLAYYDFERALLEKIHLKALGTEV